MDVFRSYSLIFVTRDFDSFGTSYISKIFILDNEKIVIYERSLHVVNYHMHEPIEPNK